jgi:hypothetical protein
MIFWRGGLPVTMATLVAFAMMGAAAATATAAFG